MAFTALFSDDAALQVRSRTMLGSQEYTVSKTARYNLYNVVFVTVYSSTFVERVLLHTTVNLLRKNGRIFCNIDYSRTHLCIIRPCQISSAMANFCRFRTSDMNDRFHELSAAHS